MLRILAAALALVSALPAQAIDTSQGALNVQEMVSGLRDPWAVGFLPGGGLLITERRGRLLVSDGRGLREVSGLPPIESVGQGGLLDVLIPTDFEARREVFFSYAKAQRGGAGTAILKARLSDDNSRLTNVETIFELTAGSSGGTHFGSRLVEARDGTLFLTIGDRGDRESAQDLSNENGTVVRIGRDGRIPADNPFVGQSGAQPAIWSYGHRNPQGATLDLSGNLVVVEHGARGGDEINRVTRGANYGWPVIAYGTHYSGGQIGVGTSAPGMEQPDFFWDPSMAPSGMMIYSGKLWPDWRGDIFVGSLKFDYISRLDGEPLREVEQISGSETERVRDVREGPNGAIWFLSVGNGSLYRVTPG